MCWGIAWHWEAKEKANGCRTRLRRLRKSTVNPASLATSTGARAGTRRGAECRTVHAWGDAEFGAEGAVEIRHIAEAAIEGDVEDPCRLLRQPHRRFTQARPQNVLVRCHA